MFPEVRAEMARRKITLFMIASDPRINKSVSTVSKMLSGEAPITVGEAVAIKAILRSDLPLEKLFESDTEAENDDNSYPG